MNVRQVVAAALASLLAACGTPTAASRATPAPPPVTPAATAPTPPPEPPGVSDSDLGLARGSVFEVIAPPPVLHERSEPGEKAVVPRAFPGAPPVAPHDLTDYTPITRTQNSCLDCHQIPGPKKVGQPTPIPPSHYVDVRRAPDKTRKTVAGARHVCTLCHVSRTDQGPLVENPD